MSSVSKHSSVRPASQAKKSAGKGTAIRGTKSKSSGSSRSAGVPKVFTGIIKKAPTVSAVEVDMSDLVPSDATLAKALRRRKVEMEWYDDGHPDAKPAKR